MLGLSKDQPLRLWLRALLVENRWTFRPMMSLKVYTRERMVNHQTELVIEGYPRSANTFAVVAMEQAQNRPIRLAHHLHTPQQLIWGVRHNIPCLLLLREPSEAVSSFVIRNPNLSLQQALRNYVRFHQALLPYREQIVVAQFEEITADFGGVIERVNAHYGTVFLPFIATEENRARCMAEIERRDKRDRTRDEVSEATVSRPSAERQRQKQQLLQQLGKNYGSLQEEAEQVFRTLVG